MLRKGGANPVKIGKDFEREVQLAVGTRPGVIVHSNQVRRVALPSGAWAWTGVGGEGAPDLLIEVVTPQGIVAAVWVECKAASGRLTPEQRRWHEAAAFTGRHTVVARSVEHVVDVVEALRRGQVIR